MKKIFSLLAIAFALTSCINEGSATRSMEDYMKFRVPNAQNIRIQCQSTDTDGNKYVSCEAAFEVKDSTRTISKTVVAECPVLFTWNDKCRQARHTFTQ